MGGRGVGEKEGVGILMERISEEELLALKELALREPQKSFALLREYEDTFEGDPNLRFNSGGLLIDIGTDLNRPDLVEEGIQRIEGILGQFDDSSTLFYNLANGYSALSNLERRLEGADYRLDPDDTPLVRAKYYYRKALAVNESNRDLRTQQWINYGNCLSGLGRTVEAMSAYDQALQLFPEHPMAKGNLGIELHHFARIADHSIFLLDAQQPMLPHHQLICK